MKKVSIIVPVYNVEPYLAKCLDSLAGQTLQDIEIIVINDGSTDNSLSIAQEYSKRYDNISIYSKKNGGLASARNYGLSYATGQYISFIDSDDWIETNAMEILYNTGISENSDIVICDIEKVDDKGNKLYIPQINKNVNDLKKAHMIGSPGFCNRIFKKSFLDRIGFCFFEGIYYEDLAVHAILVAQADSISYVEQAFYKYFIRQGSIIHQTKKNDKCLDAITSVDYLYQNFNLLPNSMDYQEELEYIHINEFLYTASFRLLKFREYDTHVKHIAQTLTLRFPHWRKNKYFKTHHWKYKVLCNLLCKKRLWLLRKIIEFYNTKIKRRS